MALPVVTQIQIGSTPVTEFTDLTISQSLFGHHHFSLGIPYDRLEGTKGSFISTAHQQLCGQRITIAIGRTNTAAGAGGKAAGAAAELEFQGIVTDLDVVSQGGLTGSFRVQGYSPTYLLDQAPVRRTFRDKTLLAIFEQVMQPYQGLLSLEAKPQHTAVLPYVVQYDESDFNFLHRLAAQYGEWLYYDGKRLQLGRLASAVRPFVSDGVRSALNLRIALRHSAFVVSQYNLPQHETLQAKSSGQSVSWLGQNPLAAFALSKSEGVFPTVMQLVPGFGTANQTEVDAVAARYKSQHATGLLRSSGWGEEPTMQLGTGLDATGEGLGTEAAGSESLGKYRLTELVHTVDASDMYANQFEAVPWSAEHPPLGPHRAAPVGQPELAEVVDLEDELNMGRVRVRYYWPVARPADAETTWLRVSTPYSGDGKGQMFTPEKGSQVFVGYEHNRAEQPVVLGNLFHPLNPQAAKYTTAQNHLKGMQTAGGNKFVMADTAGAQTILISNSNNKATAVHVSFAGDGSVNIRTNGPINLTAGADITLQATKNIVLQAGENITLQANKNINLVAKKAVSVQALDEDVAVRAKKEVLLTALEGDMTLEAAAKKMLVRSADNAEITATGLVKLNGSDVKLNG